MAGDRIPADTTFTILTEHSRRTSRKRGLTGEPRTGQETCWQGTG
jgi:hypothetical protein